MNGSVKFIIVIIALAAAAVSLQLVAGPNIIRDDRVTDIGATPALGRGYTLSTNTFQSMCLKEVQITDPSYDFTYRFIDVSKKSGSDSTVVTDGFKEVVSDQTSKVINPAFMEELRKIKQKQGEKSVSGKEEREFHSIMAIIDMDTYYASVDESRTPLSESAARLLEKKDIPAFFNACGTYYVRSLNRNAKYICVFNSWLKKTSSHEEFKGQLEEMLKGFRAKLVTKTSVKTSGAWFWKKRSIESTSTWEKENIPEQKTTQGLEETFNKWAEDNKLTIDIAGFGIGKSEGATLVAANLDDFKSAVKQAFISMQNPMTGKVVSIEVVPWVENSEFQDRAGLEMEEPAETTIVDGKQIEKKTGEKVLLYEKKLNLNLNGEYLAELERHDRQMLNNFYKAKLCRGWIESNYMRKDLNNLRIVKDDYVARKIINNKNPENAKEMILISDLYQQLAESKLDALFNAAKIYRVGVTKCIRGIMNNNMYLKTYREISDCENLLKNLPSAEVDIAIENYCMPTLEGAYNRAEETMEEMKKKGQK